jgi:uncharacterized protein (DUF302 family)
VLSKELHDFFLLRAAAARSLSDMDSITQIPYGQVVRTELPFAQAIEAAKAALQAQGFGILCEIDVTKSLQEKTGAAFRPYRILGACNPQFALQALETEPQLGLLLPCNVVVQEQDGKTVVSAVDAKAMLGVVGRPQLSAIAAGVNERLAAALTAIAMLRVSP